MQNGLRVPSVTQILRDSGLVDLSKVPKDVLRRARKFGTHLHKALELHDKGSLDMSSLDKNLVPCLNAYFKWLDETGAIIEPDSIEKKVYSEKYQYAGRLDRIYIINGKRSVVEFKSGGIYSTAALQLAAYQFAENEGLRGNMKVKDRQVIRLKEDGDYELAPPGFFKKSDFSVFLAALTLVNWRKEHKNG